ncbi:MAG: NAD(P)/FAD-dependent oxidoreductase [Ilumatobacteraceae bacterium]
MPERADVIVIGAGVIGSSVALELARSGRTVIVVDKGLAIGAGSTSSSSAIIRFSYSTLDAVLTAWESAALWRDWERHLGTVDPDGMVRFVHTGNLIFHTPGFTTDRIEALWDEVGIRYQQMDAAALHARFPDLDIGQYFPPKRLEDPHFADDTNVEMTAVMEFESGYVDDPMLAAHNLAHAARQLGAEFRFRSEVVAVDQADGHVTGVRLADGTVIEAPVVVNVGGPHSGHINELAGVADGMRVHHRPLRQEVFSAEAPKGLRLEDGFPIIADLDLGQYIKPQIGGTWLIGGTEPECDELHWVDDPDRYDEYPSVEQFEVAMMRTARRAPEFGVPHRPVGLAALYDASEDWVPIYDKSDLGGFFMACGTSGNQFKNAPLAGKFIRALVDAARDGQDHDLQPVQFTGERTGRTIDLGAFSRRRDRALTSGTVMG